ncbi:hypothetical protein ACE6H2_000303 [Prunus campanulata]
MVVEMVDDEIEFPVLASHPLWAVMSNQHVVDSIKQIKDAQKASEYLIREALGMLGIEKPVAFSERIDHVLLFSKGHTACVTFSCYIWFLYTSNPYTVIKPMN